MPAGFLDLSQSRIVQKTMKFMRESFPQCLAASTLACAPVEDVVGDVDKHITERVIYLTVCRNKFLRMRLSRDLDGGHLLK